MGEASLCIRFPISDGDRAAPRRPCETSGPRWVPGGLWCPGETEALRQPPLGAQGGQIWQKYRTPSYIRMSGK